VRLPAPLHRAVVRAGLRALDRECGTLEDLRGVGGGGKLRRVLQQRFLLLDRAAVLVVVTVLPPRRLGRRVAQLLVAGSGRAGRVHRVLVLLELIDVLTLAGLTRRDRA